MWWFSVFFLRHNIGNFLVLFDATTHAGFHLCFRIHARRVVVRAYREVRGEYGFILALHDAEAQITVIAVILGFTSPSLNAHVEILKCPRSLQTILDPRPALMNLAFLFFVPSYRLQAKATKTCVSMAPLSGPLTP